MRSLSVKNNDPYQIPMVHQCFPPCRLFCSLFPLSCIALWFSVVPALFLLIYCLCFWYQIKNITKIKELLLFSSSNCVASDSVLRSKHVEWVAEDVGKSPTLSFCTRASRVPTPLVMETPTPQSWILSTPVET